MPSIKIDTVPVDERRTLPVIAEVERMMEQVRTKAYELFAERGFAEGRDLDDWLAAERLIFSPDTEIVETDADYEIRLPLKGFEPSDLSVTAVPGELIVKAATVLRRVQLPVDVAIERTSATFTRGWLTIVAPKSSRAPGTEVLVAA